MRAIALFVAIAIAAATAARAEDPKIPSDEEITKKIVGKWTMDIKEKDGEISALTVFKKDGSFEQTAKIKQGEKGVDISRSGTWKIEKGRLILIEKPSAEEPKGSKDDDAITAFGDKEMKLKGKHGPEEIWKRAKE